MPNNKIPNQSIENTTEKADGFAGLGIEGILLNATTASGLVSPKPIQRQAIPPHLAGRDILGIAQTGSGKTAAFALPILSKIIGLGTKRQAKTARALILAPTRELAVQIETVIKGLARGAHISTALVLGGVSRNSQVNRLKPGVDILIATPGRLTDLIKARDVDLSMTRWLVLDEADRMLDMGFIRDVRFITARLHERRQTALFSATMPSEVAELAETLLADPVRVEVVRQGTTVAEISQSVVMARTPQKRVLLSKILSDEEMRSVIVFSRTKHGADRINRDLVRDGFSAAVIHGNKSQNARQAALNGFRDGRVRILVATDIAARGIDVPGISHVVNFDLPDEAESYVHRIGRTGRNGESGIAITFCDPSERAKLKSVERVIRMQLPVSGDHLADPDPVRASSQRSVMKADNDRGIGEADSRPETGQARKNGAAAGKKARDGEKKPRQANRHRPEATIDAQARKPKQKKRWNRRKFAKRAAARAA